jgi:hypothetical protein
MKKFLTILITAVIILSLYTCTARAAEPETDYALTVSVEDITAVMEQMEAYDAELDMLARLVWGEARGVDSTMEQAAVIWCALNRVDAGYSDGTISGVVRARAQFAYSSGSPVTEELRALAQDVVIRWLLEKRGIEDVGRVLPAEYLYFAGHDGHNWFRIEYRCRARWDWSLPDPYGEVEG